MSKVTRRDFVKTVGAGAATLATAGAAPDRARAADEVGADAENDRNYDVIVIGGGFAGVTAARETSRAGLRTVILEARNRLGGRTHTAKFAGHKVEVGGTWIHWAHPHVWAEVMRYGLDIVETPGSNPDEVIWLEGDKRMRRPAGEVWEALYSGVDKLGAPAIEVLPQPFEPLRTRDAWREIDELSLSQGMARAKLSPFETYVNDSVWGLMAHNRVDIASYSEAVRWYALLNMNAPLVVDMARYKLKEGTGGLIDRMMADGSSDVRLGTPVKTVSQKGDVVTVVTEDGETYRARSVIVTVPQNVLKDVEFEPALSSLKVAASRERHAGNGTKLFVEVRGDLGDIYMMAPSDQPLSGTFTYERDRDTTLFVGFGTSRDLIDVNDRKAVGEVIRRYVPNAEVTQTFGYDWTLDPYSQGTWSFFKPRQATLYWEELQRTEGRVYFASGDNADGFRGWIDGAIERGLSVSTEVRELLS